MSVATPTRLAVFAPVAEENRRPDAVAVIERALELIAARSPAITFPIIDGALAAGTITRAEHATLIAEVVGATAAEAPARSEAMARLRAQIRAAIGRAAPALARPLLDEAVASERLTVAQEVRILQRLRRGALRPASSFL